MAHAGMQIVRRTSKYLNSPSKAKDGELKDLHEYHDSQVHHCKSHTATERQMTFICTIMASYLNKPNCLERP